MRDLPKTKEIGSLITCHWGYLRESLNGPLHLQCQKMPTSVKHGSPPMRVKASKLHTDRLQHQLLLHLRGGGRGSLTVATYLPTTSGGATPPAEAEQDPWFSFLLLCLLAT